MTKEEKHAKKMAKYEANKARKAEKKSAAKTKKHPIHDAEWWEVEDDFKKHKELYKEYYKKMPARVDGRIVFENATDKTVEDWIRFYYLPCGGKKEWGNIIKLQWSLCTREMSQVGYDQQTVFVFKKAA